MKRATMFIAFLTIFCLAFLTGCPDGGGGKIPVTDATDQVDLIDEDIDGEEAEVTPIDVLPDVEPVDLQETTDIPPDELDIKIEEEVEPPPQELTFCVMTETGCLEEALLDLTLDEHDIDSNTPGLQVEILVTVANVTAGENVQLWVDQSLDQTTGAPVGNGQFQFPDSVTLSQTQEGACHEIQVKIPDGPSDLKQVCAETGNCGATLDPGNDDCLAEDSDPGTAGFQFEFTVTSAGTDCDVAWIDGEGIESTGEVDLVDGTAVLSVTLDDSGDLECLGAELVAHVSDSSAPEREETVSISYLVDTSSPVVAIELPSTASLNQADDEDPDTEGTQITVSGSAVGVAGMDAVDLWINGELSESGFAPDGAFQFSGVTLDTPGLNTIEVRTADCCENEGSDEISLVYVDQAYDLVVLTPIDGTTLFAVEDGTPGTEEVFETDFLVMAPLLEEGDLLEVECRKDTPGSVWSTFGSLNIGAVAGDAQYTVEVELETATLGNYAICRATYDKVGTTLSPLVGVTIAIPAPQIIIGEPADGALADGATLAVSGAATGLAGQTITLQILNGDNVMVEADATATDSGFYGELGIEALVDGSYTVKAAATDQFGNDVAEQAGSVTEVTISVDNSAPILSVESPLDGFSYGADCPDSVDLFLGCQIEVVIEVSGEVQPESVEVCLTANGYALSCVAPAEDGGQHLAHFYGVTLIAGENVLEVTAEDGLGLAAEPLTVTGNYTVDAPRLQFVSPAADLVTSAESVTVILSATSPDALTALEDAAVTLYLGGVEFMTKSAGPGGNYSFEASGFQTGVPITIQGAASHANYSATGYSDVHKITKKSDAPSIAITDPPDGTIINLGTPGCAPGAPGCKLTVTAETGNVEDGVEATLSVTCEGQPAVDYQADVAQDAVMWSGVTLADNAVCILVANATDLAQQNAVSDPVSVTIDRTAPAISSTLTSPPFELMPVAFDEDADAAGYQATVTVKLGGVEAGQTVTISIQGPGEEPPTEHEADIADDIADGQWAELSIGQLTFDEGAHTFTISVSDLSGNETQLVKTVQFFLEEVDIRFTQETYVEYKTCTDSSECGKGICAQSVSGLRCVLPWKSAPQSLGVYSSPAGLFDGVQNARLCSDHADLEGNDECDYAGEGVYRVVKTIDHAGGNDSIGFNLSEVGQMPQGIHQMFVEAQRNDTQAWVSSMMSAYYPGQSRAVLVDTVAPAIGEITFTADTLPPLGVLSQAEEAGNNVFGAAIAITGATGGTATVSVNGIEQGTFSLSGDSLAVDLSLFEGYNDVCVTAKDTVGNNVGPVCEEILVDTVAPSLEFSYPSNSPLLAGSSADVQLLCNVQAATVHLEQNNDGWQEIGTATVGAQNIAQFDGALADDGSYELRASVEDAAFNQTTTITNPAIILVDRNAPTVTIDAPLNGAALAEEDDLDEIAAGFQLSVQFTTTDLSTFSIAASRCDAAYANCEAPLDKTPAPEDVSDLGGGVYAAEISLGKLLNTMEYRIIEVAVQDATGNETTDSVEISLELGSCAVAFLNLPESGYINNSYCSVAGEDCANADADLTVSFAGACGDIDQAVLYLDDVPGDTTSEVGDGTAAFSLGVDHGDAFQLEARLFFEGGDTGFSTGAVAIMVDLQDPVPVFDSPTSDPFLCNMAADLNGAVDGCQTDIEFTVTGDNLSGGVASLVCTDNGGELSLGSVAIDAQPFSHQFDNLSLEEKEGESMILRTSDAAGNESEVSIALTVDVTAPSAISLHEIDPDQDVVRRRPSVRLTWFAVGDDGNGGGPVDHYEYRYSTAPITDEAAFDAACDPAEIEASEVPPEPGPPGDPEDYDITGPDQRAPTDPCRFVMGSTPDTTYYFGVRAVDNAGNKSPFSADDTTSTSELTLKYSKVDQGTLGAVTIGSSVYALGDINGDAMAEMAIGGGSGFAGFCVVKGHVNTETVIDLSKAASDPNIQCVDDGLELYQGYLGALGDINGDGYGDVGVTAFPGGAFEQRIYMGNSQGFVDGTAAIVVKAANNGDWMTRARAAGNFNGDKHSNNKPLNDLLVTNPLDNTVFLIPGDAAFATNDPVTIDLALGADLEAWSVVSISGIEMGAGDQFGQAAAGVGNLLPDAGTAYDDIAIGKAMGNSAVYLIPGRALAGGAEALTISGSLSGNGTEDAASVKLIGDAPYDAAMFFGIELVGNADLDDDGELDLVVSQHNFANGEKSQIYVFYGASFNSSQGETVQLGAAVSAGDGIFSSALGLRIEGNVASVALPGNFDDASVGQGASLDLAYGRLGGLSVYGEVYVRLNMADVSDGGDLYPYVDLTIEDPWDPGTTKFGAWLLAPVGDVNGDGLPDLLVATDGLGYAVLAY